MRTLCVQKPNLKNQDLILSALRNAKGSSVSDGIDEFNAKKESAHALSLCLQSFMDTYHIHKHLFYVFAVTCTQAAHLAFANTTNLSCSFNAGSSVMIMSGSVSDFSQIHQVQGLFKDSQEIAQICEEILNQITLDKVIQK